MSPTENSKIGWTTSTWNPVTGCTQISPGCAHCYAKAFTERWGGDFSQVVLHEDRLTQPLKWKSPRRIFVNSMSDLFHEDVPFEFIDQVFAMMLLAHWHTYQALTKRAGRMHEYMTCERTAHFSDGTPVEPRNRYTSADFVLWAAQKIVEDMPFKERAKLGEDGYPDGDTMTWPLPNVWLGVSVENQHFANERIPILIDTPAAVRWVSYEPALEAIRIGHLLGHTEQRRLIDWVVCGGESGKDRRPFSVQWARLVYEQCREAGVPFFMKQDSAFKSEQQGRIPDWLWAIKEYPATETTELSRPGQEQR